MNIVYKGVLLLFIFLLVSCKKDKKSNPPPVITVNAPISGQPCYYALDSILKTYTMTINVNAQVSDNEHLASISVTLTDINHVPQQASVNVPISSADFVFNINYEVTKFNLPSGTYYIQITASDGTNTTVAYQPIYIYASPTQLWGYCAVFKSTPNTISYYDTSSSVAVSTISLTQPYNGMCYSGYNEQLYVNGNGTQQPFQFYSMQALSGSLLYSESASTSQQNYTCIYTDGNKPYVGFYNGNIYSYLSSGSISTSYGYMPSTLAYPYCFTTSTSYGVAAFRNTFGTPNDQIVAFTLSSGGPIPGFPVALAGNTTLSSVVAMFEKANDSLYVLGNDASNNAVAYLFYPPIAAFTPISMPLGKLLSATKVNNGGFIFSTANGVYACNGLTVNPVSLLPTGAQKVTYQPGLNMLTVASAAKLNGYYVATTSLTPIYNKSPSPSDSIVDFVLITNK